MKIYAASAVAPTFTHKKSLELIGDHSFDPVAGSISLEQVQLCPQHAGMLNDEIADRLADLHKKTQFRLHASVKVSGIHRHAIVYASNAHLHQEQIKTTARLSRRLNATGYSIHAGVRSQSDLNTAFDAVKRMSDQFQCRVGIEGLYPPSARENHWLLSTWAEYQKMLYSGIDYALDLSHLNIVGKREKFIDIEFTKELLQSPQCMEIHISDNNGRADSHKPLTIGNEPWWWDVLVKSEAKAPIFYEGAIHLPKRIRNHPYKV